MHNQLAAGSAGAAIAFLAVVALVSFALAIFLLVAYWKVFTKAGRPGWACLIPIYNTYVLLKISGKPGWWLFLLLIPIVNIVVLVLTIVAFARSFGKGGGFAVGLFFLPVVFVPILAFGDARYVGPGGASYVDYGQGVTAGYGPPQGYGQQGPPPQGYGPPR